MEPNSEPALEEASLEPAVEPAPSEPVLEVAEDPPSEPPSEPAAEPPAAEQPPAPEQPAEPPEPAALPLPPSYSSALTSMDSCESDGGAVTTMTPTSALFRLPLRVGCVGGGQLGRMMALEAPRLNIVMSFLDAGGPTCPAAQVVPSSRVYQGTLHDATKIRQLVQEEHLDVLTVEIEHVGVETLLELEEQEGVNVQPSARVLQIIRDKYVQKQHLAEHSIPTAPFRVTSNIPAIQQAAKELGLPIMLKSRRGGYDGRGNAVLKADTEQAILDALWTLDSGNSSTDHLDLYAEGWIDHLCEISVLVVQSTVATIPPISYPPVTTIQQDSVCRVVLAPAPNLSEALSLECQRVAQQAIQALSATISSDPTVLAPAAGVYGVELFVTRDHQVLVNEIAPRPHNTGHFTQDACHVNQFENHLRAVSGLPLGSTDLKVEASAMINIMGAASSRLEDTVLGANLALTMPRATVHWYGKEQCRKGRKMGHINLTADSLGELFTDLLPLLDLEGIPRESVLSATSALLSTTMPLYLAFPPSPPPLVAVIMGSQSDLPTMQGAVDILKHFDIPHQVDIVSAHRTPDKLVHYAKTAEARGIRVIIAGAGGAAHLPGMVASLTPLPVIGVPVMTSTLHGVDSLYSIVQMPKGIPVATVAIGNAPNAGLLAVRILSTSRLGLRRKLQQYQQDLELMVDVSSAQLQQLGSDAFLRQLK